MVESADYQFVLRRRDVPGVVVFVHGLGGHMVETWGRMPTFVARYGAYYYDVMLWSYPTGVIGDVPPVDVLGGLLVSRLKAVCSAYRDIVLVGHSLGCLIIESAVVVELRVGKGTQHPVRQIRHVVLYAPPHAGSGAARLARRVPVLANAQVRFLGGSDDNLITLQREWVNWVYRPLPGRGIGYTAHIPMTIVGGRQDRPVPRATSQFVYADPVFNEIEGTHKSVKLPLTESDISFSLLRDILSKTAARDVST